VPRGSIRFAWLPDSNNIEFVAFDQRGCTNAGCGAYLAIKVQFMPTSFRNPMSNTIEINLDAFGNLTPTAIATINTIVNNHITQLTNLSDINIIPGSSDHRDRIKVLIKNHVNQPQKAKIIKQIKSLLESGGNASTILVSFGQDMNDASMPVNRVSIESYAYFPVIPCLWY
jgi:hypothetical protein